MQKKQATKLEQLKHLKASQERAKTRRGSEATKGFQASKGTKTPKARPWYIICLPTSNTYQRSPLLNNATSQQSNIFIFKHFNSAVSPQPNIWTTSYPGKTFSQLSLKEAEKRADVVFLRYEILETYHWERSVFALFIYLFLTIN